MQLDEILWVVGDFPLTYGRLIATGAGLAILLLIVVVALAWRSGRANRASSADAMRRAEDLELKIAELTGQVRAFAEQTAHYDAHLARTLDERLDQVSFRLGQGLNETAERTSQSLKTLHERLAVIDSAQRNITELSSQMVSLKDILANKQTRGAFGQARMEAIIRDGLHQGAYSFQITLSNGTRPDCAVKLPESELHLVIDAKFPLEAYNLLKAAKSDGDVRLGEQRLRSDVLKHVKDIAQKYLIAGETHETAIMFVPSESIYAELYERFEDVIQKSHRQRVIIASPNILMLLVQTMQAIFKDARMREQAGQIKIEVVKLMEDVVRMRDRVLDLQKHFGLATQDVEKLLISSEKITKRGLRIEQVDLSEPQLRAVDGEERRPRLVAEN
ncbi:MAG TPA: DNA recombination protein RmuC [Aestuariivirgaceae bacterium]|jgi:DNA recombination protein RmuC